ncbi:MAG TPA: site-specific DNA-methyltransferase [Ktedonobacteraceae bacterium]|nr:site-specific DNA-methyltransferase [Ktedonobacteraceae bacterium]HYA99736.1 site-specific DNA-methyltransferase [Ktedonobacteraceae bacterium]
MMLDTLYSGDCLDRLKTIEPGSIDLVYLDPPFFTQKVQKSKTRDNTGEYYFSDTWANIEEYKRFLHLRIEQCRKVLRNTGSIFVHCDSSASHHIRLILDEIFGSENFKSEIIWVYKRWSNARRGLLNAHQTIYFYSKSDTFKFNIIHGDYSPTTNIDQILQQRERNKHGKSVYKKDFQGKVVLGKEKCGVPLSNVWEIPYLNPKASERTGYPTQKPVLLLEKIIEIATDKGDVVLDPMCGSGTSLVAAALLERHWIGIDTEPKAIELAKVRLDKPQKTISRLLEVGKDAFRKQDTKTRSLLETINALVVERNNGLDGFLKVHYLDAPVAIRIQKEHESFDEVRRQLLTASATKGCILKILVRTQSGEYQAQTMLDDPEAIDNNLLVIDSHELLIQEWLRAKQKQADIL